jgi:hypothetical protein
MPMSMSDALNVVFFPFAVLAILFIYYMRRFPRVYITDYMRGIRFVKGVFRDVLGPGAYQSFSRRVHIDVVDMRPVPVILDRVLYRDALQSDSVVSVGVELLVEDPYVAATSTKNRVGDSLPIVRDTLRSVLSRGIADTTQEFRDKSAADITTAVNAELKRLGMKVSNLEITELASRPPLTVAPIGPN